MRHFIAYHNADQMGYSCCAIPYPHVKTSKSVVGLEGVTVWLIAGEGRRSPKAYYLAAKFVADKCEPNRYPGTKLPAEISGVGSLFGLSLPLSGTSLLSQIRTASRNFQNGFHELTAPSIVSSLKALA